LLNSSLFFWWWIIHSDCYHLVARELERFPVDFSVEDSEFLVQGFLTK